MKKKEYIHREDLYTVSSLTGEFTTLILKDGDVVSHAGTDEYRYINHGRAFVKVYADTVKELCNRLSPAGLSMCFEIFPFIESKSGILKKGNGAFVDLQYLQKQTGKSYATVKRGMAELLKYGIIAKTTVKRRQAYLANPYVFMNGRVANDTLIRLFENSGWKR